jgi:hypothetical protein
MEEGHSPRPSAVIFISDVPELWKESDIENAFQDFGDIVSVRLRRDSPLSYGYVVMSNVFEAFRAVESLNGKIVNDQPLRYCIPINIYDFVYLYLGLTSVIRVSWGVPFDVVPLNPSFASNSQGQTSRVPMVQVLFSFISHQVSFDFIF